MQVLPTDLIPNETEGKILKVRMIQREDADSYDPVHLFDEGSTVSWIPCGRKLTCSFPGIKFHYGPEEWCGPTACCDGAGSRNNEWSTDWQDPVMTAVAPSF